MSLLICLKYLALSNVGTESSELQISNRTKGRQVSYFRSDKEEVYRIDTRRVGTPALFELPK